MSADNDTSHGVARFRVSAQRGVIHGLLDLETLRSFGFVGWDGLVNVGRHVVEGLRVQMNFIGRLLATRECWPLRWYPRIGKNQ